MDFLQPLIDLAKEAGPFAALLGLASAYLSEKRRRDERREMKTEHAAELAKLDGRIGESNARLLTLIEQATGYDLDEGKGK